jgi:hypothetical protein
MFPVRYELGFYVPERDILLCYFGVFRDETMGRVHAQKPDHKRKNLTA